MKKRIEIVLLINIISLIFLSGCKEIFDPEIDQQQGVIAVEGMITNQPGPYIIRVSTTGYYGSQSSGTPVENARVTVIDDSGEIFEFAEVSAGIYQSPDFMIGVEGNTYVLIIETSDNLEYRSYPQTMLASIGIDSLSGIRSVRKTYFETNYGELIEGEIHGVEIALAANNHADLNAKIRFRTDILVLYTKLVPNANPMLPDDTYYCWKVKNRVEGVNNINLPTANNQAGAVNNNVIAFIPDGRDYFGFYGTEFANNLIVYSTLYHINDDAYQFYRDVNKQLKSDDNFFSPIASQIFSNIYCVSNPEKKAIGLFEASAMVRKDFLLRQPPSYNSISFIPVNGFNNIPPANCLLEETPPFWIN